VAGGSSFIEEVHCTCTQGQPGEQGGRQERSPSLLEIQEDYHQPAAAE